MWTDLSEMLAQARPPVRGATVARELVVNAAEHEAAGGGQSDR
jgi:hypothetical protein